MDWELKHARAHTNVRQQAVAAEKLKMEQEAAEKLKAEEEEKARVNHTRFLSDSSFFQWRVHEWDLCCLDICDFGPFGLVLNSKHQVLLNSPVGIRLNLPTLEPAPPCFFLLF
jgi:hypothetical protein